MAELLAWNASREKTNDSLTPPPSMAPRPAAVISDNPSHLGKERKCQKSIQDAITSPFYFMITQLLNLHTLCVCLILCFNISINRPDLVCDSSRLDATQGYAEITERPTSIYLPGVPERILIASFNLKIVLTNFFNYLTVSSKKQKK